jgi:hypothetical protein
VTPTLEIRTRAARLERVGKSAVLLPGERQWFRVRPRGRAWKRLASALRETGKPAHYELTFRVVPAN